jgi:chemotaxis protein MotB
MGLAQTDAAKSTTPRRPARFAIIMGAESDVNGEALHEVIPCEGDLRTGAAPRRNVGAKSIWVKESSWQPAPMKLRSLALKLRSVGLGLVFVVASGCVTQKTYDTLKSEHEARGATLEEKNRALGELEKKYRQLDERDLETQALLGREQDKVRDLNARIDKLRADMAAATKDKSLLQASVNEMTIALGVLEKQRADAESRVQEFKQLLTRFRALIDAGKLKVKIVDGRMVVVLATDILFASGSATLSKEGKAAIAEVSQVLASIPKRSFQIEGHTDNVRISTAAFPSNWELASARALNVLKAMLDAGMPQERISAASFADTHPVAANDNAEGKAMNRRIDIVIVPDLSTLPGFEELRRIETQR